MSHSFSRSWKSPAVVARERWSRILKSREHLCPDSPYLPATFELDKHRTIMTDARAAFDLHKHLVSANDASVRDDRYLSTARLPPPGPAFHGAIFQTNRSAVLALQTVWSTSFPEDRHVVAPWPGMAEMRADGDDRVAASVKLARVLAPPRIPRDSPLKPGSLAPQYPFDTVGEAVVDKCLFERAVGDFEALMLLGEELMRALDPVEIY